jgi:hypothetical protein
MLHLGGEDVFAHYDWKAGGCAQGDIREVTGAWWKGTLYTSPCKTIWQSYFVFKQFEFYPESLCM